MGQDLKILADLCHMHTEGQPWRLIQVIGSGGWFVEIKQNTQISRSSRHTLELSLECSSEKCKTLGEQCTLFW